MTTTHERFIAHLALPTTQRRLSTMALDCFSRYTLLAIHCAGPSDTPQQQRDAERAAYLHARALYRAAQPFLTTDADCWPGHVYSGSASPEDHARSFGPSHPRARGAWRK